jgi:hypothetical protein
MAGVTLGAIESMLRVKEYRKQPLAPGDLVGLKKQLVERDCAGLVEFVETSRTLDSLSGLEKVKAWLRQDMALWKQGDTAALPKGYLICGVPVVKLKNFRDKWVGSTEGNLERIFRLLEALGRCYVFVDEADQALGKRDSGNNDSGLSGRVYSMIAEAMGSNSSRGRII